MDKQLFIFSRTQKVDYGVMVSPASDFCPVEVKKFFREQVRGLLNADQYTPDFTTPRWLLSRVGDLTLWGVGCWNETHGGEFTTDEAGRRHLRNFVGIVYRGEVQALPYDMAYFSKAFNEHIGKLWNMSRMDIKVATGVVPVDYTGNKVIKGGVAPGLNTMPNRCLTIDTAKAESLIGAALITKGNVSIAINLLDVNLACDDRYQFLNASVINHPGGQVHAFTVASKIPKVAVTPKPTPDPEPEPNPNPNPKPGPIPPKPGPGPVPPKPEPPKPLPSVGEKKSSDPFKIIAFIELLIIIGLLIAYCTKGGDKEESEDNDNKQEQVEKPNDKPQNTITPTKEEAPNGLFKEGEPNDKKEGEPGDKKEVGPKVKLKND